MRYLNLEHVDLRPNIFWYTLELEWDEANMTLSQVKIKLTTSVKIPMKINLKLEDYKRGSITISYHFKTMYDMVSFSVRECY